MHAKNYTGSAKDDGVAKMWEALCDPELVKKSSSTALVFCNSSRFDSTDREVGIAHLHHRMASMTCQNHQRVAGEGSGTTRQTTTMANLLRIFRHGSRSVVDPSVLLFCPHP
ncbi:hypothetical protein Y032_0028g1748 [Ancylostoma ceylanicum]|uniref:Uncharacterized protein n=1 Tax=Ancylostoma ceylanicum TaxID=53326 RepID=A0A016UTT7_9BILA|nr:hypothetical protein Y032_0028g1748 [Ancylostoma ceylanicum]